MLRLTLPLAGALMIAAAPAIAQDGGGSDATLSSQAELVGNMGKIEANIAEAHARLFTHMLLPEGDPERQAYAENFQEDMESVDAYLAAVMSGDVPPEAMDELEQFQSEWSEVKDMANGLVSASRDNLASVEDIKSFSNAVIELDDYIDAALEAAGVPDDDDGPGSATN